MKRALLSSALTICFGLIAVTGWLLCTPIPAYAQMARCTALCGGGSSVTCEGKACSAQDGVGCMALDGISKACG